MYVSKDTAIMIKQISENPTLTSEEREVLNDIYIKACIDSSKWNKYMKKRRRNIKNEKNKSNSWEIFRNITRS